MHFKNVAQEQIHRHYYNESNILRKMHVLLKTIVRNEIFKHSDLNSYLEKHGI